MIYETGLPPNLELADYWYGLAAAQRYPLAKEGAIDVLALSMSGTPLSESEIVEIVKRRLTRTHARQKLSSERLKRLDEDAKEAIRRIKPG